MFKQPKGKDISIFSMFKHTDPHTIRVRSTLKDGVVNERIFRYWSFHKLKVVKEANDLAKVLLEPNQKSNELSMNRKYGQRFTTDDRKMFMKVLGADEDKVHCNLTLGNSNKDAMFDCNSGFCQSEDKHNLHFNILHSNCHIYVTSIIYYVVAQTDLGYIISCYFLFLLSSMYYIRMECLVSNNMVSNECVSCDVVVFF